MRSVNLAEGTTIYCTLPHGPVSGEIRLGDYADGKLGFMKANPCHPESSPRLPGEEIGAFSVLVGIDGYYPAQHSGHAEPGNSPRPGGRPGDAAAGQSAFLTDRLIPPGSQGYLEERSTRYPFKVVTQVSVGEHRAHIWDYPRSRHHRLSPAEPAVRGGDLLLTGRSTSPTQELKRRWISRSSFPTCNPW